MAIAIFEIGSLVCALSPSSIALIVGRAIQGVGAAGTAGGGFTITAFVVPPHVQPIVVGLMGSVFTIASIAGPLLGGVFTSQVTWRWCFYINLPIGGVTIIGMLLFFRTPAHAKSSQKTPIREILASFDPLGSVLMFSGVLCFFLAVQWGGVTKPWNSATEIGLLVGCVLLLALFAANEWYQGDRALIVFRILRQRSIGACSGFIFFLNAANIALQYNLPTYFQAIQGDTPVKSGIKMIPSILSTALSTMIGSAIIGKLQFFQPFLLAAGAIGTLGVGLIYTLDIDTGLGPIIGSADDVSIAISTVSFFMFLAGSWGVAVSDAILVNILLERLPYHVPGIDPEAVLVAGAAGIKNVYEGEVLRGVQLAYLDGLHGGWALATAAFGVTLLWALIPRWPGRLSPPDRADARGYEDESK
ncbi:major facilitator superfamily transporter [Seiridium cupressi]